MSSTRHSVLRQLLAQIREINSGGRSLVAIDGLDGAGKTVLTKELIELAAHEGERHVARVSIDDFHHPRTLRYANGKDSVSFYRDSYDYESFIRSVVDPFRRGLPIIPAIWDVDADVPVLQEEFVLPENCVLLVDGIFLHRPELRELWNASVWVDVPLTVSIPRGSARYPGTYDPEAASNQRYVGGQRLYFEDCAPMDQATWTFDNEDLEHPVLTPPLD